MAYIIFLFCIWSSCMFGIGSNKFDNRISMGFGVGLSIRRIQMFPSKTNKTGKYRTTVLSVVNAVIKSTGHKNHKIILWSFQVLCFREWSGINFDKCVFPNPVSQIYKLKVSNVDQHRSFQNNTAFQMR